MSSSSEKRHENPLGRYERFVQSILLRVRPAPLASVLKEILGIHRRVIETSLGDFWIDPISNFGWALCRDGVYESPMLHVLEKYLGAGGTFVDLGANEGYFTVLAAQLVGKSGRIIAIEPQNRLLPVIEENLRLNDVTIASVLNVALTDKPGIVEIHLSADTNTGSSGPHRMTKYQLETQRAEGKTLAQIFDEKQLSTVDLIKIDIEGAEYEVLLGSPEIFERGRVRAIALELHPTILESRGKNPDDITGMLMRYGYRINSSLENIVWERVD